MLKEKKRKLLEQKALSLYKNGESSLFVRAAFEKYNEGDFDTARKIIENGLLTYPGNGAALVLRGKIAVQLGEPEQAREFFKKAALLTGDYKTYSYYTESLGEVQTHATEAISYEESFLEIPLEIPDMIDEDIQNIAGRISEMEKNEIEQLVEPPVAAEIPETPQEIEHPIQPIVAIDNAPTPDEPTVVSETLAKILTNQHEFAEAIRMYKALQRRNPIRAAEFEEKIKELEIRSLI